MFFVLQEIVWNEATLATHLPHEQVVEFVFHYLLLLFKDMFF